MVDYPPLYREMMSLSATADVISLQIDPGWALHLCTLREIYKNSFKRVTGILEMRHISTDVFDKDSSLSCSKYLFKCVNLIGSQSIALTFRLFCRVFLSVWKDLCKFTDWEYCNGQTYSCPRDWPLSASWGPKWGTPLGNPSNNKE